MSRRKPVERNRLIALGMSLAGHLAVLVAFAWTWPDRPPTPEPPAIVISLVDDPGPALKPAPAAPAQVKTPAKTKSRSRTKAAAPSTRPTPAPVRTARARDVPEADPAIYLTEVQLAGAARAGGSVGGGAAAGGGGVCNMGARVQGALRGDPLVRAALSGTKGRIALVWNGDWVRSRGEEGKGLAAVREAILWEVAFAPKACAAQPMRGLVLLTLGDGPGAARLAVGKGQWRWSDVLGPSGR